jgi:uncharacterized Zn finger protein (UPF0148 family)
MDKFNKRVKEILEGCGTAHSLTDGMKKALFNNSGFGIKTLKKECDKCGFLMPKYKGRYPKACPMCGDVVNDADKEVVAEGDTEPEVVTEGKYNLDELVDKLLDVHDPKYSPQPTIVTIGNFLVQDLGMSSREADDYAFDIADKLNKIKWKK